MAKKSTLTQERTQQSAENTTEQPNVANQSNTGEQLNVDDQPNTGEQPEVANQPETADQPDTGHLCRPYTLGQTSVNDLAFIYVQTLIDLSEPHCEKFLQKTYWETDYEKTGLYSQDRIQALFRLISQDCSFPEASILATALKAETRGLTLRLNCLDDLVDLNGREQEMKEWSRQVGQHKVRNQQIANDIVSILDHLAVAEQDSAPRDSASVAARTLLEEVGEKTRRTLSILKKLDKNLGWFRYNNFKLSTYYRLQDPLTLNGFSTDDFHAPLYGLVAQGEPGEAPIAELYELRRRIRLKTGEEAWKPFPTVAEKFMYDYYDDLKRQFEDVGLMCCQETTNEQIVQFFKKWYLSDASSAADEKKANGT